MAAEQPARRRSVIAARWFAVAYVLASLVAFLIGKPLIRDMPGEIYFLLGHCLLGPLSTLIHSIWGFGYPLVGDWVLHGPGLTFYAVETLLLAGSLVLWTLRLRIVRWLGYIATAMLWLGSGFMQSMIQAYGA
jgi:hypothetical protein